MTVKKLNIDIVILFMTSMAITLVCACVII